jgi:hypothetical protein
MPKKVENGVKKPKNFDLTDRSSYLPGKTRECESFLEIKVG